jgi:hypothetical protein
MTARLNRSVGSKTTSPGPWRLSSTQRTGALVASKALPTITWQVSVSLPACGRMADDPVSRGLEGLARAATLQSA